MKDSIHIFPEFNPSVGDLRGNADLMLKCIQSRSILGETNLYIFPELAITGYPPKDLLLDETFIHKVIETTYYFLDNLPTSNIMVLFGTVTKSKDNKLYNSAILVEKGRTALKARIIGVYHKKLLPNYSMFNEERYFSSGDTELIFEFEEEKYGVVICEDSWDDKYSIKPTQAYIGRVDNLINISASPYSLSKLERRIETLKRYYDDFKSIYYVNQYGGQDGLVFDGNSFVIERDHQKPFYSNVHFLNHVDRGLDQLISMLGLGIKDYLNKTGHEKVIIGISGGVDSALVLYLTSLVLHSNNIIAVTLPTKYNSKEGIEDSKKLCNNLIIGLNTHSIQEHFDMFSNTFPKLNIHKSIAYENIQARIRANILLAISNNIPKSLVLTTGNKTELSLGYYTIFGDSAGGYNVLGDIYKTTVYKICRHINDKSGYELIPENIINKPASAELANDQTDEDTLGKYEDVDSVLKAYIEKQMCVDEIVFKTGKEKNFVLDIINKVKKNEFKRRTCAPCIIISDRDFNQSRQMPIANKFNWK